jgi:hypothetical protein
MKNTRRRRHLRPRLTRCQVRQELRRASMWRQLLKIEAALELGRPTPDLSRLRWLHNQVLAGEDVISTLEAYR